MRMLKQLGLVLVFAIATTVWFLLATLLTGRTSDSTVVGAGGLMLLALTLVFGLPKRALVLEAPRRELALAAGAGILMVLVAPLLVLANRYSDAPPGTEVLFFTTAAWGALSLLAAAATRQTRLWPGYGALSAAALLGAAALLANWERPSSFSPFIRYWRPEIAFLVAGVAWAAGTVILVRAARTLGPGVAVSVAGVAGGASAVAYAVVAQPWVTVLSTELASAVAAGLAFATAAAAWAAIVASLGTERASFAWYLPPVLMTVLGVVEQAVRPRGPDPVVWLGASGGIALIAGALVLAWALSPADEWLQETRVRSTTFALILAVTAAAISFGTLFVPAIQASVSGSVNNGEPYSAQWAMLGFETVGGWLPVVVAVLALAGAWLAHRAAPRRWVIALGAAAIGAAALYPLVASTPLHTWNTWLPSSIQAEFGTEYVSLRFATVHHALRFVALGSGAVAAAFLLLTEVRNHRDSQEHGSSEVL